MAVRDVVGVRTLSFGELEDGLAYMNRVIPSRRPAFLSRLKQWQKMGFPDRPRAGRGTRARYSLAHMLQLTIMIELLKLGLTPERAIGYVRETWPRLREGLITTFLALAHGDAPTTYVVIQMNALIEMVSEQPFSIMNTATAGTMLDTEFATLWSRPDVETGEPTVAEEAMKRDYTPRAWEAYKRKQMACSILLELDRICMMTVITLTRDDATMDGFAAEFQQWEDENTKWQADQGKREESIYLDLLREQSEKDWTLTDRFHNYAVASTRKMTGRYLAEDADVDPEA